MRERSTRGVKVMSALLTPIREKQEEFHQTLLALQAEGQREPGCLEFVVGRSVAGGSQFLLFMVWQDLRSLNAYLETENFRILLGATSVLSAPADFRFIAVDSNCLLAELPDTRRGPAPTRRRVPNAS